MNFAAMRGKYRCGFAGEYMVELLIWRWFGLKYFFTLKFQEACFRFTLGEFIKASTASGVISSLWAFTLIGWIDDAFVVSGGRCTGEQRGVLCSALIPYELAYSNPSGS